MGELIEGAMQQAAQAGRQSMAGDVAMPGRWPVAGIAPNTRVSARQVVRA